MQVQGFVAVQQLHSRVADQRRNQQAFDAFDDSDAGRPGTGNTIDNTTTRNRTTPKPETKPKSSKKFNGKSFDDFIKDANRKNKAISQDIQNLSHYTFFEIHYWKEILEVL